MSIRDLRQSYADDEARRETVRAELRESIAHAERRINEILISLHKDTGMFVELEIAPGMWHTQHPQGDSAWWQEKWTKFPEHQKSYRVVARMTA